MKCVLLGTDITTPKFALPQKLYSLKRCISLWRCYIMYTTIRQIYHIRNNLFCVNCTSSHLRHFHTISFPVSHFSVKDLLGKPFCDVLKVSIIYDKFYDAFTKYSEDNSSHARAISKDGLFLLYFQHF